MDTVGGGRFRHRMNSEAENLSPRRGDRLESAAFAAVIAYLVIYLLWLAVGVGNREAIGDAAFLPLCALAALAAVHELKIATTV